MNANNSNKYINFNKCKIIGVGEATHGQLKLNMWRIKLFKMLVNKYNFNVLVLEEQYSCAKILDMYVKNKINDYMFGIDAFPFLNTTFVKLLKWMRNYNKKNNNKLSVIGIDCSAECNKYNTTSKITQHIKKIIIKYNKNPTQHNRDKFMFNIFMKQYDVNKKYIIFAHNAHLQKERYCNGKDDRIWFGNYLSKKFKEKYFVIGNTFYNGSYLGKDMDDSYKISVSKINKKCELDSGLYMSDKKINKINFYEGGMIFSSNNPSETYYKTKLNKRFDAIIVINKECPFTMI